MAEQEPVAADKTNRIMMIMVFVMLGGFALMHLLDLFLVGTYEAQGKFGLEAYGPYHLFSSKGLYIGYQIWCIIVSGATAYGIWKKHRILTYVGIMLLLILLFYPLFTQS